MNAPAYDRLVVKLKHAGALRSALGILHWDEQVNLPPDSSDRRAQQLEALAQVHHHAESDPEIGVLLAQLEPLPLDPARRTVVRYARRDFDRQTRLPDDFVREKAALDSRAFHAWADARKRSDFPAFAPFLEKQIEMARREAAFLGKDAAPYDHMIDLHDPGLDAAFIEPLFSELAAGLAPLARKISASIRRPRAGLLRGFDPALQRDFILDVLAAIGFNWRRGRLDTSLHPFCGGDGLDTRLTTRFDENNPLDAIFSSIHEAGHAMYEQGLPAEHLDTPLGEAVGMAVHESQSRLWENQVGRSRAFWRFFGPRLRARFPGRLDGVSDEELHLAINEVRPGPIRVDADEVTYNLHILLRFEIEKALFDGRLDVTGLPARWKELSGDLLGVTPANDAEGVLQDIHWSSGSFGYFPSYCLGNMIAAQLWQSVRAQIPGLDETFAEGDFSALLNWLRENIHHHGRRFDTRELVERVCAKPLGPAALLEHLKSRYLPLC